MAEQRFTPITGVPIPPPNPDTTPEAFAAAFPKAAGELAASIAGKRQTSRSDFEQELMDSVFDLHQRMTDIGIRPATVLSSWPVELHSTGPTHIHIVPACPLGQAYVTYHIDSYGVDVGDKGGRYALTEILPITYAKDILQQHSLADGIILHGISIYMGNHSPNKENLANHNIAREKMVVHMKQLFEDANAAYIAGGKKMNIITPVHRAVGEFLLTNRYITEKQKPAWMITSRNQEDIQTVCAACGTEPEKGAFQCGKCGYIVDPELAYEKGEIALLDADGEANPAGMRTMARLSRERLEELGISHLIKLTNDERMALERKPIKKK